MSLSANVNEKAALIWAIADKLTGVYKPHEYGEVILPLTVIRRFDCILADTKDAVLEKYEHVKNLPMKDILLRNVSGKAFYNTSKYTFERLLDDPRNLLLRGRISIRMSSLIWKWAISLRKSSVGSPSHTMRTPDSTTHPVK